MFQILAVPVANVYKPFSLTLESEKDYNILGCPRTHHKAENALAPWSTRL